MLSRIFTLVVATMGAAAIPHSFLVPLPAIARQLTDARILGTLGAGDADQIESAKLALTKGSTKGVRDYASMMIHDHQASFKKNTEISKRLKINRMLPEDSLMARAHKQEMDQLNLLSGTAFDLAFLQAMVADHIALIKDVNTSLLPGATRREVKEFIREVLPVLGAHQAKGEELLTKQK